MLAIVLAGCGEFGTYGETWKHIRDNADCTFVTAYVYEPEFALAQTYDIKYTIKVLCIQGQIDTLSVRAVDAIISY